MTSKIEILYNTGFAQLGFVYVFNIIFTVRIVPVFKIHLSEIVFMNNESIIKKF